MALFSRWSTFAAAAASAGGALAVATSVMMGFEPVRAKSVEEYQREIYLHKDGAGKTLADKTAKLPKPVDLIGPAEKEKGAPLTEDERNFLTALSTHPYYAWKPTEEEKAKRDALRKKAFEEIAKRRAERASSVELKAAPVAPGLSDKEFRPFTLAQVTDVSHNTKLFRFKLPREYQALGLTVASCLVTKAEIDGAWGGRGARVTGPFPVWAIGEMAAWWPAVWARVGGAWPVSSSLPLLLLVSVPCRGGYGCVCVSVCARAGKTVIRPYTPTSGEKVLGYFDLIVKTYPEGVMSKCVAAPLSLPPIALIAILTSSPSPQAPVQPEAR